MPAPVVHVLSNMISESTATSWDVRKLHKRTFVMPEASSESQTRCVACCQERSGAPVRGPRLEYDESGGTNSACCTATPLSRRTPVSGCSSLWGSRSCTCQICQSVHLCWHLFCSACLGTSGSGHPTMLMFCSLTASYDAVQHRSLRLRHGKQVYSGHAQIWRVGGQYRAKQQER